MKESVFVDTGFWIALFDANDHYHAVTAEAWNELQRDHDLITSSFVVYETLTYLNCSLKNHRLAIGFIDALAASSITVLHVDENVRDHALALFRRSVASRFSFTDCTSFVLMHNNDLSICAGFDRHFVKQGFALLPTI